MKGDSLQKNSVKKRTAFPPKSYSKPYTGRSSGKGSLQQFLGEFQGILQPALGIRLSGPSASLSLSVSKLSKPEACLKGKKKNLGRGKTKGACEKRACVGAQKAPIPDKRPWTPGVRGSLAPQATKYADKIPRKGASIAPRSRRSPWPSLGRGAGETTAGLVRPPPVILEKVWPQNKREKKKKEQRTKTLAASRPKKGPQKVQGESQKRPGPRMAPRKNATMRDARPKRAEQRKAAGHKKKKNQKNRCV